MRKNNPLLNELQRCKGSNTLYVSDYYFALNDGVNLIFFYNPQLYWDTLPIKAVEDYVWANLEKECAVFKNFDIDAQGTFSNQNTEPYPYSIPRDLKIGNHYYVQGNHVISHSGYYHIPDPYGSDNGYKFSVKNLSTAGLRPLLDVFSAETNTPNHIKRIFDLDCLKKNLNFGL